MLGRSLVVAFCLSTALINGCAAQDTGPAGTWRDKFGTTFQLARCSGGDLCVTLNDVQGKSRTPENLAYIGRQVLQAHPAAQKQWQGTLTFNGSEANATLTQQGDDTLSVKGCRSIFCETLVFNRV